tara:strand:+ start:145 stop:795 length:651 start_codon:yes stop_codon:yes gene_type:complete
MPTYLLVAAAGVSMMSSIQQGNTANRIAKRNAQMMDRDANVQEQEADYNATLEEIKAKNATTIANLNAQSYEMEAKAAERAADFEKRKIEFETRRTKGLQRARFARAGVAAAGTPLIIESDTDFIASINAANAVAIGATNAATARNRRNLERYYGDVQSKQLMASASEIRRRGKIGATRARSQGQVLRIQGKQAKQAGYTDAIGTGLSAGYIYKTS